MAETFPLEQQRSATHDVLVSYSETWSRSKTRVDRSLGLDAALNIDHEQINDHMNYLLERYFTLTAGVELEATLVIATEAEALEAIAAHEKDLAWQTHEQDQA